MIIISRGEASGFIHSKKICKWRKNKINPIGTMGILEEIMCEKTKKSEFKVKGEELLKKVKEIIHEGNVRRIIIKNEEGKTYLEIPVAIGIVGVLLAPVWAAIGALAAVASKFKIEIVKKEEEEKNEEAEKEAEKE